MQTRQRVSICVKNTLTIHDVRSKFLELHDPARRPSLRRASVQQPLECIVVGYEIKLVAMEVRTKVLCGPDGGQALFLGCTVVLFCGIERAAGVSNYMLVALIAFLR